MKFTCLYFALGTLVKITNGASDTYGLSEMRRSHPGPVAQTQSVEDIQGELGNRFVAEALEDELSIKPSASRNSRTVNQKMGHHDHHHHKHRKNSDAKIKRRLHLHGQPNIKEPGRNLGGPKNHAGSKYYTDRIRRMGEINPEGESTTTTNTTTTGKSYGLLIALNETDAEVDLPSNRVHDPEGSDDEVQIEIEQPWEQTPTPHITDHSLDPTSKQTPSPPFTTKKTPTKPTPKPSQERDSGNRPPPGMRPSSGSGVTRSESSLKPSSGSGVTQSEPSLKPSSGSGVTQSEPSLKPSSGSGTTHPPSSKPVHQKPTKSVVGVGMGKKDIKLDEESGYRPEATTKLCIYRGHIMNLENSQRVFGFYGISYAAPPIDKLRFRPPHPVDPPKDGYFEATEINPPCFPSRTGRSSTSASSSGMKGDHDQESRAKGNSMTVASEDCLYLNIWLPDKVILEDPPGKPNLFPVLVWIHGEGFLNGMDKTDYKSAAAFVVETDIILVSVQYRLGVFGFLRMGSEYSGNMGLQDQIQAMKWLEENIEVFGGDPNAVTIMGHDIGAAFVGFHLLSKISPSYFTRAVMVGGSPLQPHMFSTIDHANQKSMDLATQLGCVNTKSVKSIMECLINLDPVSIWEVQIMMLQQGHNTLTFPFVPTKDGAVLYGAPLSILSAGKGKTCPVLLGGSSNEGSLVLVNSVEGMLPYNPTFISYDKHLAIVRHILDDFPEPEADIVLHQYKNWENFMDGYANQIKAADAVGDFYFTCPLRKFADLWSARGLPTYQFSFSQKSSAKNRSAWMGAVHGDELDFLFGIPLGLADRFSAEEVEFSKLTREILVEYIKTGEPTQQWERYGRETPHYAELKAGSVFYGTLSQPKYGPRLEHCAFWNDLFPRFVTGAESIVSESKSPVDYISKDPGISIKSSSSSYKIDGNCFVSFHNCSKAQILLDM